MGKKDKKAGGGDDGPKKTMLLGRSTNNVSMGIVGLPNVGKSSFFNLLSDKSVAAENFPFCTIDPEQCKVPVPDSRFEHLVDCFNPKSVVPAVLTVTDIAGLMQGASTGAGLGNAFLSHIAAVDGIFHVCRAFPDKEVTHVLDSVDPARDLDVIHNELRAKDLQRIDGIIASMGKKVRGPEAKKVKAELEFLDALKVHLSEGKDVRANMWKAAEVELLNQFNFLTAKPMIYLVNLSKKHYIKKKNKWLEGISKYVKERSDDKIIPMSVEYEAEIHAVLKASGPEAAAKLQKECGAKSVLPKIIKAGYSALNLLHFFTCGPDEVRAWTVRKGTLAPQAAGTIHTDFEKGFICADVYGYKTFKELGATEAKVKAAGKVRMEGKKYEVKDGDVCFFKFNAPKDGGKKKKDKDDKK